MSYAPLCVRDDDQVILTALRSDGRALSFVCPRLAASAEAIDSLFARLLIDLPDRAVEAYAALPPGESAKRRPLLPGGPGRAHCGSRTRTPTDGARRRLFTTAGTLRGLQSCWEDVVAAFFSAHLSVTDSPAHQQPRTILRRSQRPRFYALLEVLFAQHVGAYFAFDEGGVRCRSGYQTMPWQIELDLGLVDALLRAPKQPVDWPSEEKWHSFHEGLSWRRIFFWHLSLSEPISHAEFLAAFAPTASAHGPAPARPWWRRLFA